MKELRLIFAILLKMVVTMQFRRHGHKMVDFICDYYSSVEGKDVLSSVKVCKIPQPL